MYSEHFKFSIDKFEFYEHRTITGHGCCRNRTEWTSSSAFSYRNKQVYLSLALDNFDH